MSKTMKIIIACICIAVAIAIAVVVIVKVTHKSKEEFVPSEWVVEEDKSVPVMEFEDAVNSLPVMENTWETALPQTEIYSIINDHFNSPLAEGKTKKKAIVIGYDGCRVDTFRLLDTSKRSSINYILDNGGHAVFSYCGGVNYPEKNLFKTSTAPGWASMLTGQWAGDFGITKNNRRKDIEPRTLLLSLVEDKKVDSSAFYVSWKGHFTKKRATYINEKNYIEEKGLNSTYLRAENDEGTLQNVTNDLKKEDCSDFIFSIFEFCDHSGHGSNFSLQELEYVNGFREADATGMSIIEAIESRPSYDKEDWLILITTDHGGIEDEHGGPSMEERITFIVSNKDIKQ